MRCTQLPRNYFSESHKSPDTFIYYVDSSYKHATLNKIIIAFLTSSYTCICCHDDRFYSTFLLLYRNCLLVRILVQFKFNVWTLYQVLLMRAHPPLNHAPCTSTPRTDRCMHRGYRMSVQISMSHCLKCMIIVVARWTCSTTSLRTDLDQIMSNRR